LRAVYHSFNDVREGEVLTITGDAAHHLNVVRVKNNEVILLLNGKGSILKGVITSLSKNQIDFKIEHAETFEYKHELSLAIANPKKDAFEDILKSAVELGLKHIYPLLSDFSQYDYIPSERIQRVLESALIQSNNPYFPIIHEQQTLKNFLSFHQDTLVFFNSQINPETAKKAIQNVAKTILIGPEGGFSPNEVEEILKVERVQEIHLPTAIMRAPTAVASSVGYLLASENGPK
jgi:16S rRNA (uracil1498-N3)-methyltransferase